MTDNRQIAWLGTGIMGAQMARRLAEAGNSVRAWNRSRKKSEPLTAFGVEIGDDPRTAVAGADIVFIMVSDGPAVDGLLFGGAGAGGVLDALGKDGIVVVMSSIPVATAERQAEAAGARGIGYVDAPVSGGEPGARDGTLAIMAGGDRAAFEAVRDLFDILGRATYLGPAGTGSLAKLANQVIVGNTIATVAEALLLMEKGGGDVAALADALKGGFADSPILQNHGRRMVAGDFKPGAPSRLQLKDMRTASDLTEALELDLPLTRSTRSLFEQLIERGHGELDHNAVYLELRRRNGLET